MVPLGGAVGIAGYARNNSRIRGSTASTIDPAGLRSYLGGASDSNAARTVFLEIPNTRAICEIDSFSARRNRRISAQSSTASNPFLLCGRDSPTGTAASLSSHRAAGTPNVVGQAVKDDSQRARGVKTRAAPLPWPRRYPTPSVADCGHHAARSRQDLGG